jgi:predicted alpha/beta-fold hydrolase
MYFFFFFLIKKGVTGSSENTHIKKLVFELSKYDFKIIALNHRGINSELKVFILN